MKNNTLLYTYIYIFIYIIIILKYKGLFISIDKISDVIMSTFN